MVRVLHIIGKMNTGGAETFIMNVYRNIDRNKVQFDFVVHTNKKCDYDDEIERLGGKIYRILPLSKHPIKNMLELRQILKQSTYRIIHRHTNSSMIVTDLIVAKISGIKKIIVHSHSTNAKNSFLHKLFRPLMRKLADIKYACSQEAGEWLFGKKQKFEIITNGIDIKQYQYNKEIRNEVRKELGIKENEVLVGHVGRFNEVKNHEFLIDIFYELQKDINAKLVLVGKGDLQEKIKEKVHQLGIEDKVIFLGIRKDVNRILQAMDIFLFPSLYEGLPLTLIEAQAAGLKILASDTITKQCNLTGNITFLSLKGNADFWKKELLHILENNNRTGDISALYENGFDAMQTAQKLQKMYLDE